MLVNLGKIKYNFKVQTRVGRSGTRSDSDRVFQIFGYFGIEM